MNHLTVVGARGFIGSAIAAQAEIRGLSVLRCSHDAVPSQQDLGTVIYCSGLAWGAQESPVEAFRVHVGSVLDILQTRRYERLVYISSTRVYGASPVTAEDSPLCLRPGDMNGVYAQSKIAGEAAVLAADVQNRVVRLSNVFGPSLRSQLFLSDVVRQAVRTGRIVLRTSMRSAKDYVGVDNVAQMVLAVARQSHQQIYNVAAGYNTTHGALVQAIAAVLPVDVVVSDDNPVTIATPIETGSIIREFAFRPADVLAAVPALVAAFGQR